MPARFPSAVASAVCLGCVLSSSFVEALRSNDISSKQQSNGTRDLVFMHIPYNFGHTIEQVALLAPASDRKGFLARHMPDRRSVFAAYMVNFGLKQAGKGGHKSLVQHLIPSMDGYMRKMMKSNPEHWGITNHELQQTSDVTGCPMYLTPQKHWPTDVADRYFGDKKVFGVLRDPYERIVAQFRGDVPSYGGGFSKEDHESCNANAAIKKVMQKLLNDTSKTAMFSQGCTFVPQAEYFDGKHGITVPVNNRAFPDSARKVFKDHGYDDIVLRPKDILHVSACPDVWARDLDDETKAMIRQWFKRDFELLCKHFGYCDDRENTCIPGVEKMCPRYVLDGNLVSLEPKARPTQAKPQETKFHLGGVLSDLTSAKRPGINTHSR